MAREGKTGEDWSDPGATPVACAWTLGSATCEAPLPEAKVGGEGGWELVEGKGGRFLSGRLLGAPVL